MTGASIDHEHILCYGTSIRGEESWDAIGAQDPQSALPDRAKRQTASVDIGESAPTFGGDEVLNIDKTLRLSWFARRLADVVPNPWQATRLSRELVDKLLAAGESEDSIYDRRSYLAFALREHAADEVERQAEIVFHNKLKRGEIRFDLEVGQPSFHMVDTYEIPVSEDLGLLPRNDGRPVQISLFEPVYTEPPTLIAE